MRIFNKSKGILSKLTPNFGKNFNLPTDLHTSLTFIEASPSEVVETPFSKHGDFDADKSETGTLRSSELQSVVHPGASRWHGHGRLLSLNFSAIH